MDRLEARQRREKQQAELRSRIVLKQEEREERRAQQLSAQQLSAQLAASAADPPSDPPSDTASGAASDEGSLLLEAKATREQCSRSHPELLRALEILQSDEVPHLPASPPHLPASPRISAASPRHLAQGARGVRCRDAR